MDQSNTPSSDSPQGAPSPPRDRPAQRGYIGPQHAPPNPSADAQLRASYYGVKGWLLLLCLILTVFSPLAYIIGGIGYRDVFEHAHEFPGLVLVSIIDILLRLLMIAFSIYAGIALWSIRPGAVRIAKIYMISVLIYAVISGLLMFMAGLPPKVNALLIIDMIKGVLRALVPVLIWYSYLNRSRRVKVTYGLVPFPVAPSP